ncbi:DUF4394 domain-containing protein [Marinomonas sp. RSW2]|uniref:DUF4394 domain-containing protein n=1 Tax=Marinomonas maritima TaxID=2940935 RepID=A0ABT5W9F1_9GAMM|nr:DUF4394 domain-containing protein [Marinomonas maritima]MDE8601443.1 DUF4394 domain-containing protein [Marinomonas maritima]
MMKKTILAASTAFAVSACSTNFYGTSDQDSPIAGYALANNGTILVTMGSIASPAKTDSFTLSNKLDAVAYRPVTGKLLGYSNGAVYSVDAKTGKLTDLGATFTKGAMISKDASATAMDFNNAIDAVRMVGSDGTNLVYFPVGFGNEDKRANSVLKFTSTFYVKGDSNEGTTPGIFANAYTNAIAGAKASSTFQFALDSKTDSLVSLANNAGELTTVAKITINGKAVDVSSMGGFDIVSAEEGSDDAYAILQLEGASKAGLYSMNLMTGAATLMADLPMGGFSGFAVSGGK